MPKTIDQVRTVEDLAEGERALPEPYTLYYVREMTGENWTGRGEPLPVDAVTRKGSDLYAVRDTPAGEPPKVYRITGPRREDSAIYVIQPKAAHRRNAKHKA